MRGFSFSVKRIPGCSLRWRHTSLMFVITDSYFSTCALDLTLNMDYRGFTLGLIALPHLPSNLSSEGCGLNFVAGPTLLNTKLICSQLFQSFPTTEWPSWILVLPCGLPHLTWCSVWLPSGAPCLPGIRVSCFQDFENFICLAHPGYGHTVLVCKSPCPENS